MSRKACRLPRTPSHTSASANAHVWNGVEAWGCVPPHVERSIRPRGQEVDAQEPVVLSEVDRPHFEAGDQVSLLLCLLKLRLEIRCLPPRSARPASRSACQRPRRRESSATRCDACASGRGFATYARVTKYGGSSPMAVPMPHRTTEGSSNSSCVTECGERLSSHPLVRRASPLAVDSPGSRT